MQQTEISQVSEDLRMSVFRGTIEWEKVALTFDRVCEILRRHTEYLDLDGKGHKDIDGRIRVRTVQVFKTQVSAKILLNSGYLSTDIITELGKIGNSSFGVNAVSSIGIDDGFLSISISSLEYDRKNKEGI